MGASRNLYDRNYFRASSFVETIYGTFFPEINRKPQILFINWLKLIALNSIYIRNENDHKDYRPKKEKVFSVKFTGLQIPDD